MRLPATASTSSGSLVLFWPEQLPADFVERWLNEPHELLDQLEAEKQILLIDVELSGDYTLCIFDDAIPFDLEQFCTLEGKYENLSVSGPTWFGGIEFLSRNVAALAKLSRRKANEIALPAGSYSAELFSAQYPDHVYEDWLCENAGASARQWWWIQTWFASLGIVALLIFVGCLFFGTRQTVWFSGAVSAAILIIAWLMSRTAGYEKIQQARRSYAAEHPNFVLRLKEPRPK